MQRSEVEKIMNRFYDNLGPEEPNWMIDTTLRKTLLEYEPEAADDKEEMRFKEVEDAFRAHREAIKGLRDELEK